MGVGPLEPALRLTRRPRPSAVAPTQPLGRTLATPVGARLALVVDEDLAAAEAVAAWSAGARATRDLAEAYGDGIDAMAIATPAQTHADIVVAAAGAGKAVFCEKPLATELVDAARVADALGTAGTPF